MWETMYEAFWDKLEHFCYKLCRDDARAEDLAQEVFLKALQNRSLIDGFTPGQCRAWLFAAARNLYCDQVRRAVKEEALLEGLLPESDEDATAEAALGTVDLTDLMAKLDPLDYQLFTLRYAEGYNASELGRMFGLPPGTDRKSVGRERV